ncbi:MAG: NVEALA domain-containing protein [Bacteroidales bacterium]|jgi:hypothetical protein|nr:NVEALA domain-containing protein [Bacteroidales bacterium]
MKRKVISIIGLVALAAIVAFNVNLNSNGESLSDFALANVEALALDEGGSSGTFTCYSTYNRCSFWGCSTVYRCGNPCTDASSDNYSDQGTCSN